LSSWRPVLFLLCLRAVVNLNHSGDVNFDTALTTAAVGRVEQPFTFSGHIGAFTNPALTGPRVFDADLVGTGIATAFFGQRVNFFAFDYSFTTDQAATPEPSTIVLVAETDQTPSVRATRIRTLFGIALADIREG
jgi:hypothetical protein